MVLEADHINNRHLEIDSDTSDHGIDEVRGIGSAHSTATNEHATLQINNKSIRLKLDSGAETNILTKSDYETVVPKR